MGILLNDAIEDKLNNIIKYLDNSQTEMDYQGI